MTRLEDRTTPAAGLSGLYYPPTHYFVNPDLGAPAVTGPIQSLDIGLAALSARASDFGLSPSDLTDPIVTSQYTDLDSGIHHIYLRQRVNGLAVINAEFTIGVAANGAVISIGGGFVPDLPSKVGTFHPGQDMLSPIDAVQSAARQLELPFGRLTITDGVMGPLLIPPTTYTVSAPALSMADIPLRLQYVPTADGSAALSWGMEIQTLDSQHWYDLSVDVSTGRIVALVDWTSEADYHVVPIPNESPQDGGFNIISNPADPVASPFGWHDTNGVAGPEFTDTRGNNVDAHLDRDANNVPDPSPPRPDGGANLNFSGYTFDPASSPLTLQNQNAAMVNLFYMNNVLHDVHYQYGFTEAAGNFQVNNYGRGGLGNDPVQADAQDGSGTNNANMSTPADGSSPRMQMYIWTAANPDRDSDLDNGVIIHEYGHGVSNRLTGGPANSGALGNIQSRGMGEGWSDWHAIMFTQRPADLITSGHGIGTYVNNQPQNGVGIRRFRYSYDMTINPLTWDAYGSSGTTSYGVTRTTAVHRTGEIWCSALWDMNWLLINKYGYDTNLYTGWSPNPGPANAGNKLAMRLVMEGMKLQPSNPSFIQARDAIIAADIALNGGKDLFEIWSAFARRGLGQGASTPGSTSTATPTLSFTLPMLVSSVVPATGAVVSSAPTSFTVNVTAPITVASLQASDFTVNGIPATSVTYTPGATSATFDFATSPVTAQGAQAIAIAAGAFTRASDGSNVAAYGSTFYFDSTPLLVTAITPALDSNVPLPVTSVDVTFNQPVDPASVQTSDLSISRGTVTGFSLLNGNTTVRFSLADLTNVQVMTVGMFAGAVLDLQGGPSAATGFGTWTLVNAPPAPTVTGVVVGDGTAQRSMVTSLTVTFSQVVSFAGPVADAFQLTRNGGGAVNFQASASTIGGVTVVTLNGFSGVETQNGSLIDGRYTFRALASQISSAGGALNGGNDFVFGDADGLFRFFGDITGDRRVDIADFGIFSTSYNLQLGQTGYIAAFDFNGDNRVDIADFGQFSLRYFTNLP